MTIAEYLSRYNFAKNLWPALTQRTYIALSSCLLPFDLFVYSQSTSVTNLVTSILPARVPSLLRVIFFAHLCNRFVCFHEFLILLFSTRSLVCFFDCVHLELWALSTSVALLSTDLHFFSSFLQSPIFPLLSMQRAPLTTATLQSNLTTATSVPSPFPTPQLEKRWLGQCHSTLGRGQLQNSRAHPSHLARIADLRRLCSKSSQCCTATMCLSSPAWRPWRQSVDGTWQPC